MQGIQQHELAAIARLEVYRDGARVDWGTAFLAGDDAVLTALHVVMEDRSGNPRPRGDLFKLIFPGGERVATLQVSDAAGDWALLKLDKSMPGVEPLLLRTTALRSGEPFQSFGYSRTNPKDGLVFSGHIENPFALCDGAAAVQLYSNQAAAPDARASGQSGAPVLSGGAVVGIVRAVLDKDGTVVAGTLYATAVTALLQDDQVRGSVRTDPCAGVPPLPRNLPPPREPFRYLERHRAQDARTYFGRCSSIVEVVRALERPQRIVLLYGQSGVGKSSLLEAGLMPRLESAWDIRLARRSKERGAAGDLAALLGLPHGTIDELQRGIAAMQAGRPLLVILDQLEEIWTRPREGGARLESDELFARLHGEPRVILSFRKEWLPEIEDALRRWDLGATNVRVPALGSEAVEEIVLGISRDPDLKETYQVEVQPELAARIAADLARDASSAITPALSVLLSNLWREARKLDAAHPKLDLALYETLTKNGLGLSTFLSDRLKALPAELQPQVESGLALELLLFHTVSRAGTAFADQHSPAQITEVFGTRTDKLLAALTDSYLLVEAEGPVERGSRRLAHDTLAPIVRAQAAESDQPGPRARRLLEVRAEEWAAGKTGTPLDDRDLRVVELGKDGMRALRSDEQRLLDASRKAFRSRRRALKLLAGLVGALVVAIAILGVLERRDAHSLADELKQSRRTQAAQLFRRGAEFETAGDVVSALHYVTRAAEITPDDDPRIDEYLTRSIHLALAGPSRITFTGLHPIGGAVSADGAMIVADGSESLTLVRTQEITGGRSLSPTLAQLPKAAETVAPEKISISPDGKWVVAGGASRMRGFIWSTDPGASQPVYTSPFADWSDEHLFSADGASVFGSYPLNDRAWASLREGTWQQGAWSLIDGEQLAAPAELGARAKSLLFARGRQGKGCKVEIVDAYSRKVVYSKEMAACNDLAVTADGRWLAAGPQLVDTETNQLFALPVDGGAIRAWIHPSGNALVGVGPVGFYFALRGGTHTLPIECLGAPPVWLSKTDARFSCRAGPRLKGGVVVYSNSFVEAGPLGSVRDVALSGPVVGGALLELLNDGELRQWRLRGPAPSEKRADLATRSDQPNATRDNGWTVGQTESGFVLIDKSGTGYSFPAADVLQMRLAYGLTRLGTDFEVTSSPTFSQARFRLGSKGATADIGSVNRQLRAFVNGSDGRREFLPPPVSFAPGTVATQYAVSEDGAFGVVFAEGEARVFRNPVVVPPTVIAKESTETAWMTQTLWHPNYVLDAGFVRVGSVTYLRTSASDGYSRDWYVAEHFNGKPRWILDLAKLGGKQLGPDDRTLQPVPGWLDGDNRRKFFAELEAAKEKSPAAKLLWEHYTSP